MEYIHGSIVTKSLGQEKDIRFVLTGDSGQPGLPAGWACCIAKMRQICRYSQATAEKVYEEGLLYTRTGRGNMKAVRNVRKLLIDFNVVSADKALSVEALATNRYVD